MFSRATVTAMTLPARIAAGLLFVVLYALYAAGHYLAPASAAPIIAMAALAGIAGLFVWVFLRADEVQRRVVLEASSIAFAATALAIAAPAALTDSFGVRGFWAVACGSWLLAYAWRLWRVGL